MRASLRMMVTECLSIIWIKAEAQDTVSICCLDVETDNDLSLVTLTKAIKPWVRRAFGNVPASVPVSSLKSP